jgi:hypothetical protein
MTNGEVRKLRRDLQGTTHAAFFHRRGADVAFCFER